MDGRTHSNGEHSGKFRRAALDVELLGESEWPHRNVQLWAKHCSLLLFVCVHNNAFINNDVNHSGCSSGNRLSVGKFHIYFGGICLDEFWDADACGLCFFQHKRKDRPCKLVGLYIYIYIQKKKKNYTAHSSVSDYLAS